MKVYNKDEKKIGMELCEKIIDNLKDYPIDMSLNSLVHLILYYSQKLECKKEWFIDRISTAWDKHEEMRGK
jgi:hypothetical protein